MLDFNSAIKFNVFFCVFLKALKITLVQMLNDVKTIFKLRKYPNFVLLMKTRNNLKIELITFLFGHGNWSCLSFHLNFQYLSFCIVLHLFITGMGRNVRDFWTIQRLFYKKTFFFIVISFELYTLRLTFLQFFDPFQLLGETSK